MILLAALPLVASSAASQPAVCLDFVHKTSALQQLVAAHGGAWVSGGIGDGGGITHLISTAAEARKPKGKKAAK